MHIDNRTQQRNENPNYVAYFYDARIIQRYLANQSQALIDLDNQPAATYDFSSDLVGQPGVHHGPTIEQIIAHGYLAVPHSDPVEAILSDKRDTSWLGLDDVIRQIRNRYELYERNMYEIETAKCAAITSAYTHEAWHGPTDGRVEYSVAKRLDRLYKDQRDERTNLWRDVSKLRLELPERAQQYVTAYRKLSILEDQGGDGP
jgi:hypothetical protein